MEYIYRYEERNEGYNMIASPENSELELIEFGLLYYSKEGSVYEAETKGRELGINIISGKCKVTVSSKRFPTKTYESVGKRKNPFEGNPCMIYIPVNCSYRIETLTEKFEAAMYHTPTDFEGEVQVITQEQVIPKKTGYKNWVREVRECLGENASVGRLILGETINPSGNWSSYPPHKHDEFNMPYEAPYEEVYHFRFNPNQGFCFIRLYTPKDAENAFDKAYGVENGDSIIIPRGYHPISVAPGYEMCYFFALAGKKGRAYGAWNDDPKHSWIRNAENIIKEY